MAEHDVVLFGATGYTGGLVAEYLARRGEGVGRWALAGRSPDKLAAVRARLAAIDPALSELSLLAADAADPASLRAVAESARVVASTVGPFALHGEALVAACAASGTDYVDITGEPEFVDAMWLRHHADAQRTGARLVHSCGFDSIPHDLGTLFTVQQLPAGEPLRVQEYLRAGGTFSGGTYQSLVLAFSRLREAGRVAKARRAQEPRPDGRRVRALRHPPRRDPAAGGWAVFVPTIDVDTVLRSARALDRYGPDFAYGFNLSVRRASTVAALAGGASTLLLASQLPPARDLLLKFRGAGEGPTEAQREQASFRARFRGYVGAETEPRVVCEVSGGDPGYGETAKMLGEAALCLAHDDLPSCSGQVTPAVAMGDALIARLSAAGIRFEIREP